MSGYRLLPLVPDDTVEIDFDGMRLSARRGEPLAASLIANGLSTVARSFKYHRPRGIVGFGSWEPNAVVETPDGIELATNVRAFDGLNARAANCWPSARFDAKSFLGTFSALMPAGFYYKTFRGPGGRLWPLFEPMIRKAAGIGRLPDRPAAETPKRNAHCDVLVIGAGAAGLAAARAVASNASRIILLDEGEAPGGRLLDRPDLRIDGVDGREWARLCAKSLAANGVRVLARTTAIGRYDGGLVVALERSPEGRPARLWKIRAKSIVLATGAIERPLVFPDNDRPGAMLLTAALAFAVRHGVAVGREVVAVADNDAAYDDAVALAMAGVAVRHIVDPRVVPDPELVAKARAAGIECHAEFTPTGIVGSPVRGVRLVGGDSRSRTLDCDVVAMSGGTTPLVHLHSHSGGRLRHVGKLRAFVPDGPHDGAWSAGACNGAASLDEVLRDGSAAGREAARAAGCRVDSTAPPRAEGGDARAEPGSEPLAADVAHRKAFVDFAADVTIDDLRLAAREGYESVELLKRYTTTGMAIDQGRMGNLAAIEALAQAKRVAPGLVGTTTYRPPFVPVPFSTIADTNGTLLRPSRATTLTAWHEAAGAVMYEAGAHWRRPGYYPQAGDTMEAAVRRECRAVRQMAGMYDSSPLGKFEVVGPDAATFLDFVYATRLSDLAPGRGRYALQLHEDGRLFDDGIVFRTAMDRYFVTTTTGNADACHQRFEYCRQILRPELRVGVLNVTEQWADIVVCGPRARAVLADTGLSLPERFPFLGLAACSFAGLPVQVARAGFTGELSFEIFLPASAAPQAWRDLLEAGRRHAIAPVGSEANHVLRIEKGFISVGHEADGICGPDDLGLSFAVHADKPDFVGRQALLRDRASPSGRPQLVGLMARDPQFVLPEGSAVLRAQGDRTRGFVTASCWSDALGRSLAMALIEDGRSLTGSDVTLALADGTAGAQVVPPSFYDPKGERQRG
ncbi:MAG: NAD(P)-binding protein [Alphaproteobacteria bacterium]|nr:NAD(P)-binding protein [Alphaproteobacteria bacterium]